MSTPEEVLEIGETLMDEVERNPHLIQMSRPKFIAALALSGAIGGAAAYFVCKRQFVAKYERIIEEEIAEAKAFYSALNKKGEFETPEKAVKHLHPVPNLVMAEASSALLSYQGEVEEVEVEEERSVNIFVERTPDDDDFNIEEEMSNRSPDHPYVIHVDEFMENIPGHDQISITYYEGDEVLADDKDQEIPLVEEVVGEGNLQRFGQGSRDTRVVYIRNEKMQTDFEVLKSDGKYAHEVLGFEHSDGGSRARRQRNQPRKFKGEDR